jgi:hypothetical protein
MVFFGWIAFHRRIVSIGYDIMSILFAWEYLRPARAITRGTPPAPRPDRDEFASRRDRSSAPLVSPTSTNR